MKSSSGLRVVVVAATLSALPFLSCTNADLEFTSVSAAGSDPTPHAGASGREPGTAGNTQAGFGATAGDAGMSAAAGEAGDAGAAGSSGTGGGGNGGMPNAGAGQTGIAGVGGLGGAAGRAAAGGDAGRGGAAAGGGGVAGSAGSGGGAAAGGAGVAGSAGSGGGAGIGGTGGSGAGGSGSGGGASGGTAGASPVCGNQLLDFGEQCDDGNTVALDACDASCDFEQSQRANSFEQEFVTTPLCPRNAFGAAFARSGRTVLQRSLSDRVANGSLSLLFAFRGLSDLSGSSAQSFSLGVVYGAPAVAPNYDGKSDRDWWYTPAPGQVGSNGELDSNLAAALSDRVLSVNTGNIQVPLLSEVPINVSSTKLRLNIGSSTKPLTSSGVPPGHLASEHLSPSLVSFASGGLAANGDPGELCGNLSAASLSAVAIPAAYAVGGTSPCTQDYGSNRTFLDLLVGGCTIGPGGRVIAATQPDQADPAVPAGGSGAPYRLITGPNSHAVIACRDKNNAAVSLATCLRAAAFSSAYSFKTGRVIIK